MMTIFFLLYFLVHCESGERVQHPSDFWKRTSYGNELSQFYRYASLVNATDKRVLSDPHYMSNLYTRFHNCEQSIIEEKGFRMYQCRHDLRTLQMKERSALFVHERDKDEPKRYKRDCEYKIGLINESNMYAFKGRIIKVNNDNLSIRFQNDGNSDINEFLFSDLRDDFFVLHFQIFQEKCSIRLSHGDLKTQIYGGSTFDVNIETDDFISHCKTYDRFDNTYNVYRHIPKIVAFVKIHVVLNFENFDAFSDLGDWQFVPMQYHIAKNKILTIENEMEFHDMSSLSLESVSMQKFVQNSDSHVTHETYSTNRNNQSLERFGTVETYYYRDAFKCAPYWIKRNSRNSLINDYEWRSECEKYMRIHTLTMCLQHHDIYLVGESHMRYQFDISVDRYINRIEVDKYHKDMDHYVIYIIKF